MARVPTALAPTPRMLEPSALMTGACAPLLLASIALTLFTNDFLRTPLPTLPSTRARNRPLAVLP